MAAVIGSPLIYTTILIKPMLTVLAANLGVAIFNGVSTFVSSGDTFQAVNSYARSRHIFSEKFFGLALVAYELMAVRPELANKIAEQQTHFADSFKKLLGNLETTSPGRSVALSIAQNLGLE